MKINKDDLDKLTHTYQLVREYQEETAHNERMTNKLKFEFVGKRKGNHRDVQVRKGAKLYNVLIDYSEGKVTVIVWEEDANLNLIESFVKNFVS